jgi:hypothetical protein
MRRASGDAFQDFFSTLMSLRHEDDFVRVKPFGRLGDKGCDGYLNSSGQLFQCYGATNGEIKTVASITKKMKDDFGKAASNFGGLMHEWHMTHNLVGGLPAEAIQTLNDLAKANPSVKFGFIGIEGISARLFELSAEQITSLIGPAATDRDAKNLDIQNVRNLVHELAKKTDEVILNTLDLRPVSPEKLDFNRLPNHWRALIAGGWQNAPHVAQYFDRHPDPLTGDRVAKLFHERYLALKTQHLQPGDIMAALYELVTGIGNVSPQLQVAAQALLAFLFENCDIFEPVTKEAAR